MFHNIVEQLRPYIPLILDVRFKGEESADLVYIPGIYKSGIQSSHKVASLSLEQETLRITVRDKEFLNQLSRAAKEVGERHSISVVVDEKS